MMSDDGVGPLPDLPSSTDQRPENKEVSSHRPTLSSATQLLPRPLGSLKRLQQRLPAASGGSRGRALRGSPRMGLMNHTRL